MGQYLLTVNQVPISKIKICCSTCTCSGRGERTERSYKDTAHIREIESSSNGKCYHHGLAHPTKKPKSEVFRTSHRSLIHSLLRYLICNRSFQVHYMEDLQYFMKHVNIPYHLNKVIVVTWLQQFVTGKYYDYFFKRQHLSRIIS